MNTLEQDLRRELAQAGDTAEARATAARDEALRALASGARRARLRRAVAMSSAALSVMVIGAVLVLSLPRGDDRGTRPGTSAAPLAFPAVSVLDRSATPADRVAPPVAGVDAASPRLVAETARYRFLLARGEIAGDFCVLAGERSGARSGPSRVVGAFCSEEEVLARDGVISLSQPEGDRSHIGGLVIDGIDEVVLGGRRIAVRDNGFAVAWTDVVPGAITLVGPAAARVGRSHPQPGWRRGSLADGTPTVTVRFLPGVAEGVPATAGVGPGAWSAASDPNVTPVVETPVVPSSPPTAPEPSWSAWPGTEVVEDPAVTPVIEVPLTAVDPVSGTGPEPSAATPPSEYVWFP